MVIWLRQRREWTRQICRHTRIMTLINMQWSLELWLKRKTPSQSSKSPLNESTAQRNSMPTPLKGLQSKVSATWQRTKNTNQTKELCTTNHHSTGAKANFWLTQRPKLQESRLISVINHLVKSVSQTYSLRTVAVKLESKEWGSTGLSRHRLTAKDNLSPLSRCKTTLVATTPMPVNRAETLIITVSESVRLSRPPPTGLMVELVWLTVMWCSVEATLQRQWLLNRETIIWDRAQRITNTPRSALTTATAWSQHLPTPWRISRARTSTRIKSMTTISSTTLASRTRVQSSRPRTVSLVEET